MIIHDFDPVLIDFGIFQIRWYSVAYILGILLGWMLANKLNLVSREEFEVQKKTIEKLQKDLSKIKNNKIKKKPK